MIRTKEDLKCKVLEFISNTETFMEDFPEEPSALLCRAYSTLVVDYLSLITSWYTVYSCTPRAIAIMEIAATMRREKDINLAILKQHTSDWRGSQVDDWLDVAEELKKLNAYRISVCHEFSDLSAFRVTQSTQHVMAYILLLICLDIKAGVSVGRINTTVCDLALIIDATTKGI